MAPAAQRLGLRPIRNGRGYWNDPRRVAAGCLLFVAERKGVDTGGLDEDSFDTGVGAVILADLRARARGGGTTSRTTIPSRTRDPRGDGVGIREGVPHPRVIHGAGGETSSRVPDPDPDLNQEEEDRDADDDDDDDDDDVGDGASGWWMPSDKELIAAGRLDLRYALQRSQRQEVARLAGLRVRPRGRPRKDASP